MLKFIFCILFAFDSYSSYNFTKDFTLKRVDMKDLAAKISQDVFRAPGWKKTVTHQGRSYEISYAFDADLTNYVKKLMRRYPSAYSSAVVIENKTGNILTAIDYNRAERKFGKSLTFSSTHPAASIFKVITAANLLESGRVDLNTPFLYSGRSSTLYKYQLKNKKSRWTRHIDFGRAFALSNNVVFGKAAIANLSHSQLQRMANRFGFNQNVTSILKTGNSKLLQEDDEYRLAELASGFNRQTLISPVHGATIASVVANNGVLKTANVISSIKDAATGRSLWQGNSKIKRVASPETSKKLQEMMYLTVNRGTARGAYRKWLRKNSEYRVGGKTGSITGGVPFGKRDWFVAFAAPDSNLEDGISICVMIVNNEKWYIKSTLFAQKVIDYYFSRKG